MDTFRCLWRDTTGASMSEYALALCVTLIGVVAAIRLFSDQIVAAFDHSSSGLASK